MEASFEVLDEKYSLQEEKSFFGMHKAIHRLPVVQNNPVFAIVYN